MMPSAMNINPLRNYLIIASGEAVEDITVSSIALAEEDNCFREKE
jgi:hypothetical protein